MTPSPASAGCAGTAASATRRPPVSRYATNASCSACAGWRYRRPGRIVWICPLAHGHLQATGRDARGRKQYRYHADWAAHRGQTKFDRLRDFGARPPVLRAKVGRVLASGDEPTRERVLATLVRLLDTTWMRIGNDEYAKRNGSYGLSTLRADHARVRGEQLRLSFVGKSGVRHALRLEDRRIARVVRRCRELPGQELCSLGRRRRRQPPRRLGRRQRVALRGQRRGDHREGLPHLARQRPGAGADAAGLRRGWDRTWTVGWTVHAGRRAGPPARRGLQG
ncbi:MAG: hypothetical protein MZW92_48380 [Comamonadaceae bacterium]|nr:hypothetical protein [Comamonadaceae bacterium]